MNAEMYIGGSYVCQMGWPERCQGKNEGGQPLPHAIQKFTFSTHQFCGGQWGGQKNIWGGPGHPRPPLRAVNENACVAIGILFQNFTGKYSNSTNGTPVIN